MILVRTVRNRVRDESGQILVLTTLLLGALIGAGAIAIDTGFLYSARGSLQQAADAASFAGARMLAENTPADSGTCSPVPNAGTHAAGNAACLSAITNLQDANLSSGAQISWATDYQGQPTRMKVTVSGRAPSILAGIFHVGSTGITVSSAATSDPGSIGAPLALFAENATCTSGGHGGGSRGITVSSNRATINGGAASNGSVNNSNNNEAYSGTVEYGTTCGAPSKGALNGTPATKSLTSPLPDPRTWDAVSICAQPGAHNFNTAQTIPVSANGIYCSTVSLTDNNHGDTETVTLIAPSITISGQSQTLNPFTQNLLAYQTDSSCATRPCGSALEVSDNGSPVVNGDIYAPNQDVLLDGSKLSTTFVEAYDITINSNGFSMTGDGPTVGGVGNRISYAE